MCLPVCSGLGVCTVFTFGGLIHGPAGGGLTQAARTPRVVQRLKFRLRTSVFLEAEVLSQNLCSLGHVTAGLTTSV